MKLARASDRAEAGGLGAGVPDCTSVWGSEGMVGCSLGKQSVFIIMHLKERGMPHKLVRLKDTHR